jgi:hypothetical protein
MHGARSRIPGPPLARFTDGSYAGRRPPSLDASVHALLHGRVLFQYRPDLAADDVRALDRLTRRDPDQVLLFENQTGMRSPSPRRRTSAS